MNRMPIRIGVHLVVLAMLMSLAAPAAMAMKNDNPGVIPNVALPHGSLYAEWGAAWWNWALSTPSAVNPVLDPTGEFCAVNQSGNVWFLAGTFGDPLVVRECTVPVGTMLFVPIINGAFWNPEDCGTAEECAALATQILDLVDILEAEIDGVPVANLESYRAASDPFTLAIDPGTVYTDFGFEPGDRFPTVAEGFYLMLAPLSRGHHVVHFRGGISAFGFEIDITYLLHVGPPAQAARSIMDE